METVYIGNNYIEVQIVKGLLEQHGIVVESCGEALQGAVGELPVHDLLRLQVDISDYSAATEIVRAFERGDFALEDSL